MAKKRKKRSGARHSRRRVGAVHPVIMQTLEVVGGAALGAIAGVFVNQAIKTSFTTAPTWAGGAACIALGGGLPLFVKGSPVVNGAAAGLAGVGAVFAVNETFLSLPGVSGMPMNQAMLQNGKPGYVNQTVGRLNRSTTPPMRRIGNLSGNRTMAIGSLFDN